MKTINGNLEMKKDMKFDEGLDVKGNITGYFNLTVAGNIVARDIDARNIDAGNINARNIDARNIVARDIVAVDINAWNIDARNINARNIVARDIDARDIDAGNIICVSRKKKTNDAKTIAYSIVTDRYNRERKEVMPIKRGAKE